MPPPQQPFQPRLKETNPGRGCQGKVTVVRNGQQSAELLNLPDQLAGLLSAKGHSIIRREWWLELAENHFAVLPQLVEYNSSESGIQTLTTIQINHPSLVAEGVFEFQHSFGPTIQESIIKGFEQWYELDFVAFQDALLAKPKTCTTMEMSFPGTADMPAFHRRAVLGPVGHYMTNPSVARGAEGHPFCPCCFFTNTFAAFKELIQDRGFYALRFFGARGVDGSPQADCRVNGGDSPSGAEAVRAYVKSWPGTGYEFRKQYVLLHSIEKAVSPGPSYA
jgi:hypothetical protein